MKLTDLAKNCLHQAQIAIAQLQESLDGSFAQAVRTLHDSKGRIIITGIGKSALIAQKITATLNSTGSSAVFMHAADAMHGDLGILQRDDIALIISQSGESPEIRQLVKAIRNMGNQIIAMTGNINSTLAESADQIIPTPIEKEADPNNLAPTTSTTIQMVMGDAIALCLQELNGFQERDFARLHPGGALGKKLHLRVSDLLKNDQKPWVYAHDSVNKTLIEISEKRKGAVAVLNDEKEIMGIITDGDLRRKMPVIKNLSTTTAADLMSSEPKTISADTLAVEALDIMKNYKISQLIVIRDETYLGLVHLHEILAEGIS